ncbi:HS12A-like protein [Mya arenaria]|uniref:HS12A-like protein n=1 Tax=Mya arenaria TaxID=6604 RepID=A0ABY7G7H5_MYAAR|nr:HS12A-like protein [Mya arenaria]
MNYCFLIIFLSNVLITYRLIVYELKTRLLVVGIDFGTTFSGWSYSLRYDFDRDPTKATLKNWHGSNLNSLKSPTCLPIEPDGETFSACGYDAEKKPIEAGEHDNWYFFKRFKRKLYDKDIKRDMEIKDETGKKLKANIVFSVAIRLIDIEINSVYFVCHLFVFVCLCIWLLAFDQLFKGEIIKISLVFVSKPYNSYSKMKIIQLLKQAGISSDKLIIALEPEAAAIYCRFLPMEISGQGGSLSTLETGSKVLVVDAGGGTVDIAVQEVAGSGSMKNIYKASGGDWGGTKVDDAYVKFVADIIGKDTIEEFKRSHMDDYVYMIRDFEMKKRGFDPLKINKSVIFRISATLPNIVKESKGKEIHDLITDSPFKSTVSITADKLRVDKNVVKNLIENQADAIVDHVSSLLDQSTKDDIGTIVLLDNALLLEKNRIATSSQTTGPIRVYYTLDPDPMYVTDGGCHLAGTLNVPLEGRGTNRTIKARLIYGGTEIDVEATEVATGKVHRLKIDFLS